jgi:hypothetical protein
MTVPMHVPTVGLTVFGEPPSFRDTAAWARLERLAWLAGARFADPSRVPFRAGLGPAECVRCSAATLAVDGFTEPRCEACWRIRAAELAATSMINSAPRRSHPRMQPALAGNSCPGQPPLETSTAPAPGRYRVLQPAAVVADWTDRRVPGGARRLANRALEYGRTVRLTSAQAEDLTTGALIHSLCVRLWTTPGPELGPRRRFGYVTYAGPPGHLTGRGAVLWAPEHGGPRKCGIEELSALAAGEQWTPPAAVPVAPCPTCSRPVRWKQDGKPFKHNRPGDGPDGERILCQGLQSS